MPPALIVIGGFAGSGKSTIARRLSRDTGFPRLGADTIGRTIKRSAGVRGGDVDAHWIAYDVLFCLCKDFIKSGISVILDITLGWEFHWQHLDGIVARHPQVRFLPILLCCPHERCIERVRQRYETSPDHYDPPEVYLTEPKIRAVWDYLACLNRSDVRPVDADRPFEGVYEEVRGHVIMQLRGESAARSP